MRRGCTNPRSLRSVDVMVDTPKKVSRPFGSQLLTNIASLARWLRTCAPVGVAGLLAEVGDELRRLVLECQKREPSNDATIPARTSPTTVKTRPSGKSSGRRSRTTGTDNRSAGGPTRQRIPAAVMRIEGFIRVSKAWWATASRCSIPVLDRSATKGAGKENERRNLTLEMVSLSSDGSADEEAAQNEPAVRGSSGGSSAGLGAAVPWLSCGSSEVACSSGGAGAGSVSTAGVSAARTPSATPCPVCVRAGSTSSQPIGSIPAIG
eukprot:scaffold11361_cov32-Tisochrysis_lutea.AAC.1